MTGALHATDTPAHSFTASAGAGAARGGGEIQLVLLDHGSYLSMSETFRREYCELWRAMVLLDTASVEAICRAWGVRDSHFFASLQLLKPFSPEKHAVHMQATTKDEVLRWHADAHARIRRLLDDSQALPPTRNPKPETLDSKPETLLSSSQALPPELILLGRNLNIVRANNKAMGSPVNRVNVIAAAARASSTGRRREAAVLWA